LKQLSTARLEQAEIAKQESASIGKWEMEPSPREVLLLSAVGCVVFVIVVSLLRGWFELVDNFGDSPGYMAVASAIRRWKFEGLVVKHFWGYSYFMAAVSTLTGAPDRIALLTVSLVCCFLSIAFAHRLWGGWIAGFFAVLNFDWMQRSCLGGSEPLFVALLFGAFLAARRERWPFATLLAALSTVVRPVGFFSLAGVGLTLLWQRRFRKLAVAILIGLIVGVLYVLPLAQHFGDPLANVNRYEHADWEGGRLIGWPVYAIIKGTVLHPQPWTNLVLTFGWISFVLAGAIAMAARKSFRHYCRDHLIEMIFATAYVFFIYTYNSPYWARGSFPRFAIPVIPFVLLALDRWLPKDRRLLWVLGIVSPLLAAASAVGIRQTMDILRNALT
jgi:hypothetical protein